MSRNQKTKSNFFFNCYEVDYMKSKELLIGNFKSKKLLILCSSKIYVDT